MADDSKKKRPHTTICQGGRGGGASRNSLSGKGRKYKSGFWRGGISLRSGGEGTMGAHSATRRRGENFGHRKRKERRLFRWSRKEKRFHQLQEGKPATNEKEVRKSCMP